MNILIACEESQTVTKHFREKGYNAFSCDILPPSGDLPQYHYHQDVTPLLTKKWDLIIAFPPCTYLTVSANRWYNIEKYGEYAIEKHRQRKKAIDFFMKIANANSHFIAIENPVGIMSSYWRKPDQIFHPYHFGDPFEKRTCLWLKNLPKLIPSNIVEPEQRTTFKNGKSIPKWLSNMSKKDRAKLRSKTFDGLAMAMVNQWGEYLLFNKKRKHEYMSNKKNIMK